MRILMLVLLLAQEPNRIDKLIDELGHDAFTTRDNAAKALVKIGARAIPALKTAERSLDAEVRCRATVILAEIEHDRKLHSVCRSLPSLTYKADNEPSEAVLTEFKRQTGVGISGLKAVKLSAFWNATPFMAALDDLGAQTKSAWEWVENTVYFSSRPFVNRPSVYQDGFKISVQRTDSYRSWDGAGGHDILWIYLGVQVDPDIKCLPPRIQVDEIADSGKLINPEALFVDTNTNNSLYKGMFAAEPINLTQVPRALRAASLRGRAVFTFVVATKDVEISAPFQNPVTVGEFTISPTNVGALCPGLMVTRAGESGGVYRFIDFDSFEVEDTCGEKPKVHTNFTGYAQDSGMVNISFPESEQVEMKKIKFRLFSEFITKEVPFNFKKVEFP